MWTNVYIILENREMIMSVMNLIVTGGEFMLKAIFFDLDDTLLWDEKSIQISLEETCDYAETSYNISAENLLRMVRKIAPQLYAEYDTYRFTKRIGINPFEGLWGTFSDYEPGFKALKKTVESYQLRVWSLSLAEIGVYDDKLSSKLREKFIERRLANPFVYEETFTVLDKLKEKYELLLLTNGAPSLQYTKLQLTPKLPRYFQNIVISGAVGVGKPDAAIFEYALNKVGFDKKEVCMIGDNLLTDIKGANESGMDSIWINHKRREQTEIKSTYEVKRLQEILPILENNSKER